MESEAKFMHVVSKGSKFNQIYIPKGMEGKFEAGDKVEVTLIEKKEKLHFSKALGKLSPFKENLIKEIFSELRKFKSIKQIFVFGSFLTEKIDYNDIDLLLISNQINANFEQKIYYALTDNLNLKFHILLLTEESFDKLAKTCPLTRSALYHFVSDKKYILPEKTELDIKHIKFLLMMPEDLLEVNLGGRALYDSLRRLIAIEKFLNQKELNPLEINLGIKKISGDRIYDILKKNETIDNKLIVMLRKTIKDKLHSINKCLKNE